MGDPTELSGPDLTQGVALADLAEDKPFLGHAHGEPVVLVRRGRSIFAVGATCTHYSGPLAEGIVVGDTIHCPWHHACFDLATGRPSAPALNPVPCYVVRRYGALVGVGERLDPPVPSPIAEPARVVIVGTGAAGNSCAETLRRLGYAGSITMLGAEPPVDRPNLSKDYLTGNAPEEWIPLRGPEFYREQRIDLATGVTVTAIDANAKTVTLKDGRRVGWDRLVLATGAEPVKLKVPGAQLPHVTTLRTLVDSRAIIVRCVDAQQAVVVGASFIGLEVAASLRQRGLDVHVVAPETVPFEKSFGPHVGAFIKKVHQDQGIQFHLGKTVASIDDKRVKLGSGEKIPANLVIVGIGVRPATELALAAGAKVENGVLTDEYLETSLPGVYAIGDCARYRDPRTKKRVRIEHWVHAQRMGEVVAENLLGRQRRFDAVPFFWTAMYDLSIAYVGHAEAWDAVEMDGDLEARNCRIDYKAGGRTVAVLTIGRDQESLRAEAELAGR